MFVPLRSFEEPVHVHHMASAPIAGAGQTLPSTNPMLECLYTLPIEVKLSLGRYAKTGLGGGLDINTSTGERIGKGKRGRREYNTKPQY